MVFLFMFEITRFVCTIQFSGSFGGRGGIPGNGEYLNKSQAATYPSTQNPNSSGSGGGGSCGGSGGGNIYIHSDVSVQIDGLLSANGIAASGFDCGGGSGGSINIVTNLIEGTGVISANGGDGQGSGGGGGGGRVSVRNIYDRFTGTIISAGGLGGRYQDQSQKLLMQSA